MARELKDFKSLKKIAYAGAYHAFGLLTYGQGNFKTARRFFLGAVKYNPKLLFDRVVVTSILKTWLGTGMLARLKQLRGN